MVKVKLVTIFQEVFNFTKKALKDLNNFDITGPDTLLVRWQAAHQAKDYKRADKIRDIGKKMKMTLAFNKEKNRYEIHETWVMLGGYVCGRI